MFGVYCHWQLWNLAKGKIPPSLFKTITGLPCPSTGCIRSINAYLSGNFLEGFLWNPMSLVFLVLLAWSLATIGYRVFKREPICLDGRLSAAWIFALGLAWILKFMLGSDYW